MEYRIDITYPEEKITRSAARLEAFRQGRYLDRVPVIAGISTRFLLHELGVGYREFFRDAEANLYYQLLGFKWRVENIEEDFFTAREVTVFPNFDGNTTVGNFDVARIIWDDQQPPRVVPTIQSVRDIARLRLPEPTDNLCGKKFDWFEQMKLLATRFDVRLNGQMIPIRVCMGYTEGPFTAALDLCGENLLLWMYEEPRAVHDLLAVLTEAHVNYQYAAKDATGDPKQNGGLSGDGAEMLSPALFREFFIPYASRIYDALPGERRLHMCGKTDHLLEVLADELKITHLDGLGSRVSTKAVARLVGRKVKISGNVDPVLLWRGPRQEIEQACHRLLADLAPLGGLILSDGFNVPPGTSPGHINLLARCAGQSAQNFAGATI